MKKLNVILSVMAMILLCCGSVLLGTSSFLSCPAEDGEVRYVSTAPTTIPSDEPEIDEISYTFKTFDDYFVDNNISKETITEEDLSGTGSKIDPYVIGSTKGFWYLMNYSVCGISFTNKTVILDSDVYLNDETFDENGNPSGGDGIVYSWERQGIGTLFSLDGNNNTIYGVYMNYPELDNVAMFGESNCLDNVKNLNVKNVFICGKKSVSVFNSVDNEIENCNIYGNILAVTNGAGFCAYNGMYTNKIVNSNNYINIKCTSDNAGYAAGFVAYLNKGAIIENCSNYGNIEGYQYIGGFYSNWLSDWHYIFKNCTNYGNITGRAYIGGCFSGQLSGTYELINFKNYGTIRSKAGSVGGLGGYSSSKLIISNCLNKGEIVGRISDGVGGFVGQIYKYGGETGTYGTGDVTIKNSACELNGNVSVCFGFFGYLSNKTPKVYVENCKLTIKNYDSSNVYAVSTTANNFVTFKNIQINLFSSKTSDYFYMASSRVKGCAVLFENININANFDLKNKNLFNYGAYDDVEVKSYVVTSTTGDDFYYGDSFDGFYVSWRTGRIGLVSIDGKGFFQGKIDEEWLNNSKYEKKTI